MLYFNKTLNNGLLLCAPLDVKFDDGNVYQPDVLYIAESRKSEIVKERIEGAPDLIVEILSLSNAYYDLKQKKEVYEKYGVKEYLIIDPTQYNAEVHHLTNGTFVLRQKASGEEMLNSVILPGLSFDLAHIFA